MPSEIECLHCFLIFTITSSLAEEGKCIHYEVPPQDIPPELVASFTLNGSIPVQYHYVDDSFNGKGSHYQYDREELDAWVDHWKSVVTARLDTNGEPTVRKDHSNTELVVEAVVDLIAHIKGKIVGVFGSTEPWLETLLVAVGASRVITYEYNYRTYDHPLMETVRYRSMQDLESDSDRFDALFSISSFDHDGLGRFNDPVCADADIRAVEVAASMLRPDGLLFLSVPIGEDLLVWNSYRRYGRKRLPLLLGNLTEVKRYGWEDGSLDEVEVVLPSYEPLFVLSRAEETCIVNDRQRCI